ncbi:MAG TPA: polymorphic toxin-type HINT domain-containing protein [Anaerolineae bacterium]|nr:polymorphic toxin-type HINT domain-containing protein [Anaerolineae bacterium]
MYSGTTPITTTYIQDLQGLAQVLVAESDTATNYYLMGHTRIAQDNGSEVRYLLTDGLGSVRVEMVGATVDTISTYEPYGSLLAQTGSSGSVYGFAGEEYDEDTGLIYLRARYYSSDLMQFMGRDAYAGQPRVPGTMHGYSYAHSNPVLLTDPSGNCTVAGYQIASNSCMGAGRGFSGGGYGGGGIVTAAKATVIIGGSAIAYNTIVNQNGLGEAVGTIWDGLGNLCNDVAKLIAKASTSNINPIPLPTIPNEPNDPWQDIHRFVEQELIRAARRQVLEEFIEQSSEARYAQASSSCAHSFSADTLVSTPNGLQEISTLDIGDVVWAYDEATQTIVAYPITYVWEHIDSVLVYLTIDDEIVVTTPEHPFYTAEGEWIRAIDLTIGTKIFSANGLTGLISQIRIVTQQRVMYDLTVDIAHTFFVGDGEWLVHNRCITLYRFDNPNRTDGGVFMKPRYSPNSPDIQNASYDELMGMAYEHVEGINREKSPFVSATTDPDLLRYSQDYWAYSIANNPANKLYELNVPEEYIFVPPNLHDDYRSEGEGERLILHENVAKFIVRQLPFDYVISR